MATNSILPAMWQVPQVFRDRLGESAGRQRAMFADGHLLLVLHSPPKPDEDTREGRFFWRQPDGVWSTSEEGNGLTALRRHLTEYGECIERFDDEVDNARSAETYFDATEAIAPLRRAAVHLHQTLQEARKLVPVDREIINLRDQAYNVERTADLLYENAKNGLDFAIARRAEEQARSSHRMSVSAHRLNSLAALFFPIATFSAIFGVNLRIPLEEKHDSLLPFFGMIGIGLAVGIVTMLIINSRSGNGNGNGNGHPR